ncbi:MAG: cytochrome c family protein [Gammaproteobacteria bacterium]
MFKLHNIPLNAAIGWIFVSLAVVFAGKSAVAGPDPAKVVGASECGECHKKEVEAWRSTHHYTTYNELSRKKDAKKIADNMGIRRIKAESDCVNCHFTQQIVDGSVDAVSGITCESCHGAAKDWMDIHNDYGGKDVKKEQESPDHKAMRISNAVKGGMILPSDLYALANNCYQCHLVPNEKLVNKGGHKAGSAFELVSWSQGEVRHNYFSSPSGEENLEAPIERKRMFYILGNALELEHALRAIGKATEKAEYAVTMAKRVKLAVLRLEKIAAAVSAPEVKQMVDIGKSAELKLNNEAKLSASADKVAEVAKSMAQKYKGSEFAGLDSLLPSPADYKGRASN